MFNWEDYLIFAENLLKDKTNMGPEEAKLRSSISRSYYAAFCAAKKFLDENNIPYYNPDSLYENSIHKKVILTFENITSNDKEFQLNSKAIAKNLENLRKQRVLADYNANYKFKEPSIIEAINAVQKARLLIDMLLKLK
jgi:uncharacterized protein (UPF0332 family)